MMTPHPLTSKARQQGFTLLELLVIMAILGILFGLGFTSFSKLRNPARDTARTVHSVLYQLRADAAANTQARRMVLAANGDLQLQSALTCAETNQTKWNTYTLKVELPGGTPSRPVTLSRQGGNTTPNVIVCYSPRGLATVAGQLNITDTKARYAVQVALSGGVKTSAQ
ncbi:prepilin-type N-terminal cleavage/methylation domain-containing protein [Deinococcus sp. HMF7620]|uniref:Prepilin-type N-terminal cleavage/methylation domain-containing protein n=1 Tax=Deinococcus arboris TaxID=2682977 RepID=A0A7C9HSY0_9DEIO|nr:prepilin-type N-terminal cleavage/methylation domain-containing protein [Deinococcus arboris]MVN88172.1 prepilin-type N-terminal cleavage/methylation domain-containing protein [Deinococcus arboris]